MRLGSVTTDTDALASGLGDLGLSRVSACSHGLRQDHNVDGLDTATVSTQPRQKKTQEGLTPRVQQLTLEITKLQQQIKQLTRRRKKLDALNPTPHTTREGFLVRKAAEYFAIDERRRRMQSAEPLPRVVKTKRTRTRVGPNRGQSKRGRSMSQRKLNERCGVEAAAKSAPQDTDDRLSLSFLLS